LDGHLVIFYSFWFFRPQCHLMFLPVHTCNWYLSTLVQLKKKKIIQVYFTENMVSCVCVWFWFSGLPACVSLGVILLKGHCGDSMNMGSEIHVWRTLPSILNEHGIWNPCVTNFILCLCTAAIGACPPACLWVVYEMIKRFLLCPVEDCTLSMWDNIIKQNFMGVATCMGLAPYIEKRRGVVVL
jgi:hypothetical protein